MLHVYCVLSSLKCIASDVVTPQMSQLFDME